MAEQTNLDYRFNRSYEVSVWTLQDSFITVLKWSDMGIKGTIQHPKMTINTDGTQNFSFEIPMSLYIGDQWRENPIWYNTSNGTLITNMRKIKVIFNKGTEDEEIFEFLITTMSMNHSSDQPICSIGCDGGLAYHELGKQGYKISLSSDAFYEEDANAFATTNKPTEEQDENAEIIIDNDDCLHPTLDYWCEKMDLTYAESDTDITDSRKWYYRVEMDWSSYSNEEGNERRSDTIYEEEYVASWDDEGKATRVETYKEKERLIDEENSNLYNLTQNLAQTFGVFCRYRYLYDDNYHIIGRLIIFYNNFFNEREGVIQFSYPHTTTEVTRDIDSTDVVTKMYVDTIEDDSALGVLTIMNTEANKMKEDYLLNFDYLYEVKTITEDQYEAIKQYEEDIREANLRIIPLQEKLSALAKEQIDVSAKKTVADNGRIMAQERIDDNQSLITSLNNTDGIKDDVISYSSDAPDTATLLSSEKYSGTQRINLKTKGIIKGSLKAYATFPIDLLTPTVQGEIQTDDYGNVTGIDNVTNIASSCKMLYLVYDYDPAVYYQNYINTWTIRKNKDTEDFEKYSDRLEEIEEEIEDLTEELQEELDAKEEIIKEFTLMMGPALREGHWTPEDYSNYGDRYAKSLQFPKYIDATTIPIEGPAADHIQALWDDELFTDEQKNYFNLGLNETKTYYPHLCLSNAQWDAIVEKLKANKTVSLVYYDYAVTNAQGENDEQFSEHELNQDHHWHSLTLGASMQIIFIADGAVTLAVRPAIIVTDAETMSTDEIAHMKSTAFLAEVTTEVDENTGNVSTNISVIDTLSSSNWYTDAQLANNIVQVQPRIRVDTLGLMNNTVDLGIKYNDKALKDYSDYSVLTREDEYFITFKPDVFMLKGYDIDSNINQALRQMIDIKYAISNASTSIYLDAVQVLKENAYPKVSYSLAPNVLNKSVLKRMYTLLNRIININDNELQLHDAFGYISQLDLDLDHPWEDSITVQNYNNKFEDIFSTITAQTEAMQRREYSLNETMQLMTVNGQIDSNILQSTLDNTAFNYKFNDQQLTLTEEDGLFGLSDNGAIMFRNTGIFTSNTRDTNGNWVWQSAILPEGINASLIKAGQLDTDKIMIYSGNDIRFQWNSEGLYAYRSILDTGTPAENATNDVNADQYVVFNSDGLSLVHKNWNFGVNDANLSSLTSIEQAAIKANGVKQVEVSWDGFKMRNFLNQEIFFADATTGDLTITGNFSAHGGNIGGWHVATGKLEAGTAPTHEDDEHHTSQYVAFDTIGDYCILAGSDSATYAPFSVKYDGTLTATQGTIGGWAISTENLSGGYLELIGTGSNPGIMTMADIPQQERTEEHNGVTYASYNYLYTLNNTEYTGECFHTTLDFGATNSDNYTFTEFNNDGSFYHYVKVVSSIAPTYTIIKSITTITGEGTADENITISNTEYVAWTEEDKENGAYEAMTAANDPRIMKYNGTPIVYDTQLANANTLQADWYAKMQAVINAPPNNIIITGSTPLTLSTDINDYIDSMHTDEWTLMTLDDGASNNSIVTITTNSYHPTFSIEAKTGKLTANSGKLGTFTITPEGLQDGTLYNTKLNSNTYITVQTKDGPANRNMDNVGQCFYQMSLNSSKGIVTFTRLNGDKVNFKTAALKATGSANAAAGKVNTHTVELNVSNGVITNYGAVKSYIKTGYGSTSTKYYYLTSILTQASYNDGHFKLWYDTANPNNMTETVNNVVKHYVYLQRRNSAGTWSNLKIEDGGAYVAGYTAGQSDMASGSSENGSLSFTVTNNNKLKFTVSERVWIYDNTISGKIDKPSLNYNNEPNYVNYSLANLSGQKISDGGCYSAGWNAAYNQVQVYSSALGSNKTRKTLTLKTPSSTQGNQDTYKYIIADADNNTIIVTQRLNDTTSSDLIVGRHIHGKYNAGWAAAQSNVQTPEEGSLTSNIDHKFTFTAPYSTVDQPVEYYYKIENNNNNSVKVTQSNNKNTTTRNIGTFTHNKYKEGWNSCIDTQTSTNENYQKTEVINYNNEDIIVLDITNNTRITDNNHIYIQLNKHLYTLPDKKTIS